MTGTLSTPFAGLTFRWTGVGAGYCFADGHAAEAPHRIDKVGLVTADLAAAKSACEQNSQCKGIHYDDAYSITVGDIVLTEPGGYALLSKLGDPGIDSGGARTCHELTRYAGSSQS